MEFEYKIITRSSFGILSDEQFFALCQENRELKFERTKQGDIIVMPPTGGETSYRNSGITGELYNWNRKERKGVVFDSSGGFNLPNGAMYAFSGCCLDTNRTVECTLKRRKKEVPASLP